MARNKVIGQGSRNTVPGVQSPPSSSVLAQPYTASFKLTPTVPFLHTGNKLHFANSANMAQNRIHHHDHMIILKMLTFVFVIALGAFRHTSQY